ncbi:MAG: competence/damage-inducible protein A [Rhodobacterales bacterium]|nr:MAG: competence/damage-inducible protein A [Rhodobacterales bacterium]
MPQPTAAMIVIGDEILSGRTRDSNMHFAAGKLTEKGIRLTEARVIADDRAGIIATVRDLSKRCDHVLTSGGIGPTHDDITAEAVAEAMGAPIGVRDDARAILAAFYAGKDQPLTDARLRMARIPDGADLIDNPISAAPGFSLGNVHVMAGVPTIFQTMLEGLLPRLAGGAPLLSRSVDLARGEGDIADGLGQVAARYAALSIGSYPWHRDGAHGTQIVLRGEDAKALNAAVKEIECL